MTKYKVGDIFVKDGKQHIVTSVSKSNPENYCSHEVRADHPIGISDHELILRICAKLGVSVV